MSDERFSCYNEKYKNSCYYNRTTILEFFTACEISLQSAENLLFTLCNPFCNQFNYNSNKNIINEGDFISR